MRVKPRSFPYPVMSSWSDDITPNDLKLSFGAVRYDKTYYYITYEVSVANSDICALIESGRAGFLLHIECSGTFFRKAIWLTALSDELPLEADQLEGKVDINLFICAKQDIPAYSPAGIHSDYEGIQILLSRGDFLAIGDVFSFFADKQYDPLKKISSIIAFDPDSERSSGSIKVHYEEQKLVALVPKKLHEKYQILKDQVGAVAPSVLSSLLVLPVLMEGCRYIAEKKEAGLGEYKEFRWARVLEARAAELNLDFLKNDPFEIAQEVLGIPYDRTCNELSDITKE